MTDAQLLRNMGTIDQPWVCCPARLSLTTELPSREAYYASPIDTVAPKPPAIGFGPD